MDRLQRYEDGVLGFAFEAQTPFTNNQAERDLRPAKVKQKVSGGFRTLPDAQVFARLQALLSTLRKQNGNGSNLQGLGLQDSDVHAALSVQSL